MQTVELGGMTRVGEGRGERGNRRESRSYLKLIKSTFILLHSLEGLDGLRLWNVLHSDKPFHN